MTRSLDPRRFPDFSNKRVVDDHMERLDTHGVSRRDFLSLMSAGVVAGAAASALGLGGTAVAAPSGKIAYLTGFLFNEWNAELDRTFAVASRQFDFSYIGLDSQLNSTRQLNQFEEQIGNQTQGAVFNLVDGGAIRRISSLAQENKIYVSNVWDSLAWFTPFDGGDYYTLYAHPDDFTATRAVTSELLRAATEKFGGGDIVAVTGSDGNVTDIVRSRGRDDAFKDFPKTRLIDHLPGKWNREDALKTTEDLLSRNKNTVGIVANSDDMAEGVIAAIRAAGLRPGRDILVAARDGSGPGSKAVRNGQQIASAGAPGAFVAGLFSAQLYDVTHGWQPRASERLLTWQLPLLTEETVAGYINRYVENDGLAPFDFEKMSKVLHPNDWDPQAEITPLDIEKHWQGIPKPGGWQVPKAYADALSNGEREAVTAEYRDHYKIKFDGPSPNKKA